MDTKSYEEKRIAIYNGITEALFSLRKGMMLYKMGEKDLAAQVVNEGANASEGALQICDSLVKY